MERMAEEGRHERGTLDLEPGRLVNSFAMFANYSEGR